MRAGFVSIVGRPNVGKSTLLNALLKTKLVAVSDKPQTTRHSIYGILSNKEYQIIFTDTPGIFQPKYKLQEVMVRQAIKTMEEGEIVLLVVEPFSVETEILEKIKSTCIVCINKIDLIKRKQDLLPIVDVYRKFEVVKEILPISALKNIGIEELKECILKYLPENEPYYPSDYISDKNERFFVSEIIREKIFNFYGEEIPYASAVVVDEFKEREKGKYYIKAIIYVERESERAIILGKNGKDIKKLGIEARKDIEKFIGHGVYLDLWVKVRKNWRKDINAIKEFGYR